MPDLTVLVTQLMQDVTELKVQTARFRDILIGTEHERGLINRVVDLERKIDSALKVIWLAIAAVVSVLIANVFRS